jgi:hypothetical protein
MRLCLGPDMRNHSSDCFPFGPSGIVRLSHFARVAECGCWQVGWLCRGAVGDCRVFAEARAVPSHHARSARIYLCFCMVRSSSPGPLACFGFGVRRSHCFCFPSCPYACPATGQIPQRILLGIQTRMGSIPHIPSRICEAVLGRLRLVIMSQALLVRVLYLAADMSL